MNGKVTILYSHLCGGLPRNVTSRKTGRGITLATSSSNLAEFTDVQFKLLRRIVTDEF
jgi:hypothetical protein